MTAAVALGLQGCSDWDDHYDVNGNNLPGADATLWEQICSQDELSNFVTLLTKVHYDDALKSNQSFTVWAPNNNAYDFEKYNAMSDSLLKAEFLNNHIARGYHRASGDIDERIHFLNKKVLDFKGSDNSYVLSGEAVDSTNILSKNGVMHLMKGMMDFRPNFYEYFAREHEGGVTTNSLKDIFMSKMKREIDKDKSVEGPMKDGEVTYLDTVYTEYNQMFTLLNAQLTSEDSTYTMIVPSDKAWKKAYKHVEAYFDYPESFEPFTLTNDEKTGKLTYTIASKVNIDADSLKKEHTILSILMPLIFSNTVNPALKGGNIPTGATDSIHSTTYVYSYNTLNYMSPNSSRVDDAAELFKGATKYNMSNGTVWLTGDSLYARPWSNWNPTIHLKAQYGNYQAGTSNVTLTKTVTVGSSDRNPSVKGSMHTPAFYQVSSAINERPEVFLYAPQVRSTAYAVYLTMVPATINDTTAVPTEQAIALRTIMHNSKGGAPKAQASTGYPTPGALKKDFDHMNKNMGAVKFDYGTKEESKILTKYMGIFKPNMSYTGLQNDPAIRPVFNVYCSTRTQGGSTELRIAGIVLVPQEAVEYYMKNGMISDYTGDMPELFWNLTGSSN